MSAAHLPDPAPGHASAGNEDAPDVRAVQSEWYRTLFEHSLNGILLIDPASGAILAANPEACRLLRYTEAELCVLNRTALVDTTDPRLAVAVAERARAGTFRGELTYRRADGTLFPVEVTNSLFTGPDGREVAGAFFTDITERKRLEDRVASLAAIVASSSDAIVSTDLHWNIISWNQSAEGLYGPAEDAVRGTSLLPLLASVEAAKMPLFAERIRQGNRFALTDIAWRTPAGEDVVLDITVGPVKDLDGSVIGYVSNARDVTGRARAKAALHESEEKFTKAFAANPAAICITRQADGLYVDANPAYQQLTGYSDAELIGHSSVDLGFVSAAYRAELAALLDRQGRVHDFEATIVKKSGQLVDVLTSIEPIEVAGVPCFLHMIIDISKRKQLETEGRLLAERLDMALGVGEIGVWDWQRGSEEVFWDPHMRAMHGIGADVPMTFAAWRALIHPDDVAKIVEVSRSTGEQGGRNPVEYRVLAADGSLRYVLAIGGAVIDAAGMPLRQLGVSMDITARKRAEIALLESERKYRDLYDKSPDMYLSGYPTDHVIRDCNLTLARSLGYTREELVGQLNRTLFTPEGYARIAATMPQYAAAGHYENFEVQLRRKDGTLVDALMSAVMEPDPDGGPTLSRVTLHDITERKRLQDALSASEQKWRTVFEFFPAGVSVVDSRHRVTMCNAALSRILQLPAADIAAGAYVSRRYYRSDGSPMPADEFPSLRALREQREIQDVVIGVERDDGELIWTSVSATPESIAGYAVTVTLDITERKRAEAALAASEAQLKAIIENTDALIRSVDRDYRLLAANTRYQAVMSQIMGHPLAVGDRVLDVATGADESATFQSLFDRALAGDTFVVQRESRVMHPDGTVEHAFAPIRDAQGKVMGVTVLTRDVTEQVKYQRLLQDANAVLEEQVAARTVELQATVADLARANVGKDAFLAAVSHELRTPLTGILGMADVLQSQFRGPLNPQQERYVQLILDSGHKLLDTVNSVLDYTSLLAGQVKMQLEPCRVADLCEMCIDAVHSAAAGKQQAVELDAPSDLVLMSDGQGITKILTTLLDNAIKFTPVQGRIGIKADRMTGHDAVRITVWDTGIGMSAGHVAHLFDPFVQGDLTIARRFEGLGLGLAYVHKLVATLGGTITVDSALGEGSRFQVILPLE